MKKLSYLGLLCLLSITALAQNSSSGNITGTQCVTIAVTNRGVVGLQVTGTWTGTIQPQVQIAGSGYVNIQVLPSTGAGAVSNITANGAYQANVSGYDQFKVCGATVSGTATIKMNAVSQSANTGGTGGGGGGSGTVTGVTAGTGLNGGTITTNGTISLATPVSTTNGGTGADTHASTGVPQVNAGTWTVGTALPNGTTATTQSLGDGSTAIATDEFVLANVGGSPPFNSITTGNNNTAALGVVSPATLSVPTVAVGDTSTNAANSSFVQSNLTYVSTLGASGTTVCDRLNTQAAAFPGTTVAATRDNSSAVSGLDDCGAVDFPNQSSTFQLAGHHLYRTNIGFTLADRQLNLGANVGKGGTSVSSTTGTSWAASSLFPTGATGGGGLTGTKVTGTTLTGALTGGTNIKIRPGDVFMFTSGVSDSTMYHVANCSGGVGSGCVNANSPWYTLNNSSSVTLNTKETISTSPSGANVALLHPIINIGDPSISASGGSAQETQFKYGFINCDSALGSQGAAIGMAAGIAAQENSGATDVYIRNCVIGFQLYGAHRSTWKNLNVAYNTTTTALCGTPGPGVPATIPMELAPFLTKIDGVTIFADPCNSTSMPYGMVHITNIPVSNLVNGAADLSHFHGEMNGDATHGDFFYIDATSGSYTLHDNSGCPSGNACKNFYHIASTFVGSLLIYNDLCNNGTTNYILDDVNSNTIACSGSTLTATGYYMMAEDGTAETNIGTTLNKGWLVNAAGRCLYSGGSVVKCETPTGDLYKAISAPPNPASGYGKVYVDTGTGFLSCKNSSGGSCFPAGGNTTSSTMTTNNVPKATGANSIGNSNISDDGTTVLVTGTGGISASAGPLQALSDGVHTGGFYISGNTTNPTYVGTVSNVWGWLAPNSASFTSYWFQPSATAPSVTGPMLVAAASGNISAVSYGTLTGNTTKFLTFGSGSVTLGDCFKADSNGNAVDCGGAAIWGSAYQTIMNNGSSVAQRSILNIIPGTNITESCVDNAGQSRTDCTLSASSSAGSRLDQITAATGPNSINNADNAQVWNSSLTTASKVAFTFGENVAGTATGNAVNLGVSTASGSTVNPFAVTAQGTSNGLLVNTAGILTALGTGGVAAGVTAHGVVISEGNAAKAVATAAMTNGQMLLGATGADPAPQTMSQDCTITSAGVITCLKTNNVSFGTFATGNFATPSAIGGTTPAAGTFTALTANTSLVVNGGTAQVGTKGTDTNLMTTASGSAFTASTIAIGDANGGITSATAIPANVTFPSPGAIGATTPGSGKFSSLQDTGIASGTQCLHADSSGNITGTGSDCGSGSGGGSITGSGLTTGNAYYLNGATLTAAKADSSTTMPGICVASSSTVCVFNGTITTGSWTAGGVLYVSDSSAGALTQTAPSTSGHYVQRVGIAVSTTVILIMPSLDVGGIQ